MTRRALRTIIAFLATALQASICVHARELSFAERVAAQEAIERVYYSHQTGTTTPFEEAASREVLENKVRTYLKQSAALEVYWHNPITPEGLERELERIFRDTRMPDRLHEIVQALGADPLLIRECLARPALVDRLARSFFSTDQRIHGGTRAEAEALRDRLASGRLSVLSDEPHRTVSKLVVRQASSGGQRSDTSLIANQVEDGRVPRSDLTLEQFEALRRQLPKQPREIGPVIEEQASFHVQAILSEDSHSATVVTYSIPKVSWNTWWDSQQSRYDGATTGIDPSEASPLPDLIASPGIPQPHCADADTWDNGVLDDLPESLSGHVAVWTGSVMIVWGGTGGTSSGSRYDPITDAWSSISSVNAPSPRFRALGFWTGRQMIVWGGQAGSPNLQSGGVYDLETDTWSSVSLVNAPSARSNATGIWTGQEMIIWGGVANNSLQNTGARYDPVRNVWSPVSTLGAPSGRTQHSATWTGNTMVIWGGFGGNFLRTGGKYDPVSDTWTTVSTTNAPSARILHTAVWSGERVIVWGGQASSDPNKGGQYDPVSDSWTVTSTISAPAPRSNHSAMWTGSHMIVWGGSACDEICQPTNSGSQYEPVSDTWSPISITNAPPSYLALNYSAIWSGSLMIVWGGDRMAGRRYHAETDTWTPISTGSAPAPTNGATAVWTGNLVLVWGGTNLAGVNVDTGGRYDPTIDSWAGMSSLDVPAARTSHTAVWSGSRMVIWGGEIARGQSGARTGGLYDPISDEWIATSLVNAPAGRAGHSAVWTGDEMIVWGGLGLPLASFSQLDDGGRYHPSTDTWSPMARAPRARYDHVAVWTGNQMLVWGDIQSFSGSRYDPTSDAWEDLSRTNAPAPTSLGRAVWTGELMVVWGGWNGNTATNIGGRYDPSTNSWQSTNPIGAPTGRYNHTAVWTGTRMIVWGGTAGGGGQYDPVANMWQPVSNDNSPSANTIHTAVWTGKHMIIWGGREKGGRYAPDALIQPPVADAGPDHAEECGGLSGTSVVLSGNSAGCINGGELVETWYGPFPEGNGTVQGNNPTVTLPIGSSTLTLRVVDGYGQSADDTVEVTVRDTAPPVLTCPSVPAAECSSPQGTSVAVPLAQVVDVCDAHPTVENTHGSGGIDATGIYPLGQTEVELTATDASGNQAGCSLSVTVRDSTPPLISTAIGPAVLWPPNHRMVDVGASVIASDACSIPATFLASLTSSETDDIPGGGDGVTQEDIQGAEVGTGDLEFQLRAERDGDGEGRAYRVTYVAVDGSGNQANGSAVAFVPHDQSVGTEPVSISAEERVEGTVLRWNPIPTASSYKIIRGALGSLREAVEFIDLGTVSCVQSGSAATTTEANEDSAIPPVGQGFFYLVAYNANGDSGYGTVTAMKPRVKTGGGCD